MLQKEGQVRIPAGCAISGIFHKDGTRETGERIIASIRPMHDRSNGLGGGFAGYGIYPEYADYYAFHVFYDTPEAKAINWEIMESFGNDVQATLDAAESGETPSSQYMEVTWQSYWNDSLLSLSIRVLGWTSDLIDYAVYHYDFETGQRPDNLELLDRFHVDEGDFIAALRRGAARQFDSHYAPWGTGGLSPEDENYGGIAIDLAALRAWTVAEENFSLDLARFCPNGDGTFTAFQPVASIAGGNG